MMEVNGIAETSGFVDNIGPVSYTHLDVYKRQVMDNEIQEFLI